MTLIEHPVSRGTGEENFRTRLDFSATTYVEDVSAATEPLVNVPIVVTYIVAVPVSIEPPDESVVVAEKPDIRAEDIGLVNPVTVKETVEPAATLVTTPLDTVRTDDESEHERGLERKEIAVQVMVDWI